MVGRRHVDGHHGVTPLTEREPRLPRWLSPPVLVCGLLVALLVVFIGVTLAVVGRRRTVAARDRAPACWRGSTGSSPSRVVADPRTAVGSDGRRGRRLGREHGRRRHRRRDHGDGGLSAPSGRRGRQGVGDLWAVRRRELDGMSDGIVYAGWVALGFAVVEDMTYFAVADVDGALCRPWSSEHCSRRSPTRCSRSGRLGDRPCGRIAVSPVWPSTLWGYASAVLTHMRVERVARIRSAPSRYDVDEDIGAAVLIGWHSCCSSSSSSPSPWS